MTLSDWDPTAGLPPSLQCAECANKGISRWPFAAADELEQKGPCGFHPFMPMQPQASTSPPRWQFWLFAAFVTLVFLSGGASRIDVQSLLLLRPLSVLMCAIALITLRKEHLAGRSWLLWGLGSIMAAALAHLIPLPPSIWQALPGRDGMVEVEKLTGLSDVWRPLTLTPMNGWHAFAALFTPLAVLLLGLQLSRDDLFRCLALLIGFGALSGLFGLFQVIGDAKGPLYFYRITNNGSAVGFFANRNHAAVLLACMMPMLAVYATASTATDVQLRRRRLITVVIAVVLVPLILVTGSRSGLFLALVGLGGAAMLYGKTAVPIATARKLSRVGNGTVLASAAAAILSLGFLTYFFARAEAIDRLLAATGGEEKRSDFWVVSVDLFWKYFPVGSGSGSFVEAFQIAEPNTYLDSTYLNHAHNDWIEVAMTWGLPGVLFILAAIWLYGRRILAVWTQNGSRHQPVAMARMAATLLIILAMGSFADYPLRTPSMMAVFVIISLWLVEAGRSQYLAASGNADAVPTQEKR
jgi:O-antigen ligase